MLMEETTPDDEELLDAAADGFAATAAATGDLFKEDADESLTTPDDICAGISISSNVMVGAVAAKLE
jgi:hypothetical protein